MTLHIDPFRPCVGCPAAPAGPHRRRAEQRQAKNLPSLFSCWCSFFPFIPPSPLHPGSSSPAHSLPCYGQAPAAQKALRAAVEQTLSRPIQERSLRKCAARCQALPTPKATTLPLAIMIQQQREQRHRQARPGLHFSSAPQQAGSASSQEQRRGRRGVDNALQLRREVAEGRAAGRVDLPAGLHQAAPLRLAPGRHLRRQVAHHQACALIHSGTRLSKQPDQACNEANCAQTSWLPCIAQTAF